MSRYTQQPHLPKVTNMQGATSLNIFCEDHYLPFHGNIDWLSIMAGLHDIEYSGPFCYKVRNAFNGVPMTMRGELLAYAAKLRRHLLTLGTHD